MRKSHALPLLSTVLLVLAGACHAPARGLRPATAPAANTPAATNEWSYGGELQQYPVGTIVAAHAQRPITEDGVLTLRAGYNFTYRDDEGDHNGEEEGGGPGIGAGYRHFFGPMDQDGWLLGGRIDFFYLDVDWRDDTPTLRTGDSQVFMIQPTLEGGYQWCFDRGRLQLTIAGGAEINADTSGEDVGEGAIGLIGLTYVVGR